MTFGAIQVNCCQVQVKEQCCILKIKYTHLDERSNPRSTQHRHLAGIDAVGPVFTRMVHAQDSVQHLLLLTVAWERDHTVGT